MTRHRRVVSFRTLLFQLSLVCREWKELTRNNCFWEPIARTRMPLLTIPGNPLVETAGGSIFAYLARYGKALHEKTRVVEDDWCKNVIGQIEIFDALDDFRMFSACGPIRVDDSQSLGSADEDDGAGFILRLAGTQRHEMVGQPFSAQNRGGQAYDDIEDFFKTTHGLVHGHTITINISLTWAPTGKTVVLWHSGRDVEFQSCTDIHPFWDLFLPAGSLFFQSKDKDLAPPPEPRISYGMVVMNQRANIGFYLSPLPNQEQVSEAEKLWEFAGGDKEDYDKHDSFVRLHFKSGNKKEIADYLRSLFEGEYEQGEEEEE